MEQIRRGLVNAHVDSLKGATPESPRVLTADEISVFHEDIFLRNGAGPVFGGDTLGYGFAARWFLNKVSPWCTAPSCRLK
jgi:hypothetical protein